MATRPPSRAGSLALIGGALALDFCNTCAGRGGARYQEQLRAPTDVLAWAAHAGLAVPAVAPSGLLERALALRETVHGLMLARIAGCGADARDLAAEHLACLAEARLEPDGGGYHWRWRGGAAAVLGPVALSAVALLTRPAGRLRQCAGPDCGWLFLDTSRNGARRWCEMAVCGNRAKQRRRRG